MLHRITFILFLSDEELSAAGSLWALVKNADAYHTLDPLCFWEGLGYAFLTFPQVVLDYHINYSLHFLAQSKSVLHLDAKFFEGRVLSPNTLGIHHYACLV